MGTVYARGDLLWLAFKGPDGTRVYRSSGFRLGEERRAKAALQAIEDTVARRRELPHAGVQTLASFCELWVQARKARGLTSARDDNARLRDHVLPELGHMVLDEVRSSHVREMMAKIQSKTVARGNKAAVALAPRTVMNIYGALHRLFEDALGQERVARNPCVLSRHELPGRKDANRQWRATAVYTRPEVEQLVSDARVPLFRRVVYGFGLLAGMREGEIAALTWGCYDDSATPLGSLAVHSSYTRKNKAVKGTKAARPRSVPVHPVLAGLLAEWKATGWASCFGREPRDGDLLVPNQRGRALTDNNVLEGLAADLTTLGLRHRRFHDTRRTFISLGIADGARTDVLRWVTHGPKTDVMDLYTSLPWPALCEAVAALKIRGVVTPAVTQTKKEPQRLENVEALGLPRAGFEASRRPEWRSGEVLRLERSQRLTSAPKVAAARRGVTNVTGGKNRIPLGVRARRLLSRFEQAS